MKRRILLVDDERSIRESLRKLLQGDECEVVLAEDGQEAIAKHGLERIDLVLLDLNMPRQDGWAVLEWLAEINPLLPVIIITGRCHQSDLAEAAGADALMEKPLDVPALLQTIQDLLAESVESRAQRVGQRVSHFRHLPCDGAAFRELQLKRFTTPYPCPGLDRPRPSDL